MLSEQRLSPSFSNTYLLTKAIPKASSESIINHTSASLESHVEKAALKKVKKHTTIYTPTSKVDKVYLIKSGSVTIGTRSVSGKEISKALLTEGEIFGEKAIFNDCSYQEFATTREDSELYVFSVDMIKELIQIQRGLGVYFINLIGTRSLKIEKRLESLVFHDSRTRVIDFLLDLAARHGKRVGFETLVPRFMTHQEIANHTSTSRQTVTTILNELRNNNILTFNRRRLLIRDMEQLAMAK